MRAAALLALLVLFAACAPSVYAPTVEGPSATLRFTSPYLEDRFMSIDRLHLVVLSERCGGEILGRIPIDAPPSPVVAGRPLHLRLWMNTNEFMGPNQTNSVHFSFEPRENVDYHVVHIDNPGRMRFELDAGDDSPVEFVRGCSN